MNNIHPTAIIDTNAYKDHRANIFPATPDFSPIPCMTEGLEKGYSSGLNATEMCAHSL